MGTRSKWIDCIKVEACILVVLGHFYQSMIFSGMLPENEIYNWFIKTVYCFHVQLFFICSGFLYQKYSKVNSFDLWIKNSKKKLLSLGVPYLFFSTVTWLLKSVFSGSVNNEVKAGLADSLLRKPVSPYWYLYALFFIFLLTWTFSSTKKALFWMICAIAGKIYFLSGACNCGIYAVTIVLQNEVWFVGGMLLCYFKFDVYNKQRAGRVLALTGFAMSIMISYMNLFNGWISFGLGIILCFSVIFLTAGYQDEIWKCKIIPVVSKYTMPIFLMHTIFAAPFRVFLLKIGIENIWIHILGGLMISFGGPVLAARVMKKLKYPEFVLYPQKFR